MMNIALIAKRKTSRVVPVANAIRDCHLNDNVAKYSFNHGRNTRIRVSFALRIELMIVPDDAQRDASRRQPD